MVNIQGDLDNTGTTFTLNATTGDWNLAGGRIIGGTIVESGGNLLFTNNGNNRLDGATLNGDLNLTQAGGAIVRLQNGATFTGNANLGSPDGSGSILGYEQTGTLDNKTLNLDGASFNSNVLIEGTNTLTFGANLTARGAANIGSQLFVGGTNALINQGLISADVSGQTMSIVSNSFTNSGIAEAINGGRLGINSTVLTNYDLATTTLTGGTWKVTATGSTTTLALNQGGNITVNDASVLLSGADSVFSEMNSLANNMGTFAIANDRDFTTAGALTNSGTIIITDATTDLILNGAFSNSGDVQLAGGRLAGLTLTNSGDIFGFGTVTGHPTNTGTIRSAGGALVFNRGIEGGSGTVQVDPGSSLDLSVGPNNSSADFLIHNGNTANSLNLGTHSFTVLVDYTNASFGTGNAFNPRANVGGTGQILAAGNVGQTVSGNVTNGASSTPTMAFGNVHVGDSPTRNYQINNTGTTGPALRGALQTSANGGNITDGRLSGSGVTASNFGPIALSGNTGDFAVTFTATTAGALTMQILHLINNFDNVAEQDLAITGAAFRFANPTAHTPEPVNFGNFHVGDAAPSQARSLTNNVTADGFSEALNAAIGGATGGVTTNSGSFNGLAPGQTNNTSLVVGIGTATAGNQNGTATITLASDGAGSSGLGVTSLTSQIVNVSGGVYRLANPTAHTPEPVSFGIVHVGDPAPSQPLSLTNNVPADGFSEALNASIGGATGGVTTNSGSFSGLAPGATNGTSLAVGIDTSTRGNQNGTATITLASDGTGSSGLGVTALPSQTVNVTGQVNEFAQPLLFFKLGDATLTMQSPTLFTLDFGQVDQNSGTYMASFGVRNTLLDAVFQDALGGTFSIAMVDDFTLAGFNPFSGIAPGGEFDPDVSFNSTMAMGSYSDILFLNPTSSNASGTANLNAIQLNLQAQIIPEPSTWALLIAGGGMLFALQRARRRRL